MNDDGITMDCNWNTTEGDIGLVEGAKNGTVAAGISGVWSANSLKEALGKNYAAVKLPTYTCAGKQIQMASFSGYKMVGVNAYSKHQDWSLLI